MVAWTMDCHSHCCPGSALIIQMSASQIPYALVDAFATGPFTGNQAAVIVTREALPQALMQKIAAYVLLAHAISPTKKT
jgi:hypothetical protein